MALHQLVEIQRTVVLIGTLSLMACGQTTAPEEQRNAGQISEESSSTPEAQKQPEMGESINVTPIQAAGPTKPGNEVNYPHTMIQLELPNGSVGQDQEVALKVEKADGGQESFSLTELKTMHQTTACPEDLPSYKQTSTRVTILFCHNSIDINGISAFTLQGPDIEVTQDEASPNRVDPKKGLAGFAIRFD